MPNKINRQDIEEVKKILLKYRSRMGLTKYDTVEKYARQICQLFPQPLPDIDCPECDGDGRVQKFFERTFNNRCPKCNGYGKLPQPLTDEKLREKVAEWLCLFDTKSNPLWKDVKENIREYYRAQATQILALLQQKIEEARKIGEDLIIEHRREYEAKLSLAKDIAIKQERERIVRLLKGKRLKTNSLLLARQEIYREIDPIGIARQALQGADK